MSNFAARNLSLGQINALVKMLGGEAVVLDIITGIKKFSLEAASGELFDEVMFFQDRSALRVDSDLLLNVGLQTRSARPYSALTCRQLLKEENEATIFGQLGSEQHAKTLEGAVDLGQIAELIRAHDSGTSDILLDDGSANLFAVRGHDGCLHNVWVHWDHNDEEWNVLCWSFHPDNVWWGSCQVFSN